MCVCATGSNPLAQGFIFSSWFTINYTIPLPIGRKPGAELDTESVCRNHRRGFGWRCSFCSRWDPHLPSHSARQLVFSWARTATAQIWLDFIFVAGDADFLCLGCSVITALWTYGAPGFNLQSGGGGGGGVAEINKSGQRVAWPPGSSSGKGTTAGTLVHVQGCLTRRSCPQRFTKAWKFYGRCLKDRLGSA